MSFDAADIRILEAIQENARATLAAVIGWLETVPFA